MIPKDCKRLAEVDFPIAAVSEHAAREKSTPQGHPSKSHLWWARRPLASSRAVLATLLLPDPGDPLCPATFKTTARKLLQEISGAPGPSDDDLRKSLLRFIADFSKWEHASYAPFLDTGRRLVRAANGEEAPLVVDPFAGGGSIPVEALRLGCDTFASDLNPVATLILKVLLEIMPADRHEEIGRCLTETGTLIGEKIADELAELYPCDKDASQPIAYLWARSVRCEAPNCGAEIPLVRSLWLSKKARRLRALRPKVLRKKNEIPTVDFEIFEPHNEAEVVQGTVSKAAARCLCCSTVLSPERVRAQLSAQRGGGEVSFDEKGLRIGGARMLAVVTVTRGIAGRQYRQPTRDDYSAVHKAQSILRAKSTASRHSNLYDLDCVPNEPINPIRPSPNARGLSAVTRYGIETFGDLFTTRQKAYLLALTDRIRSVSDPPLARLLACALSRVTMSNNSCTRWNATAEKMQHAFGRQALPMVWDFAEVVPIADAPGNWRSGYELIAEVAEGAAKTRAGHVQLADAGEHPLPSQTASVWFTDPPYYDAIPYSDLADFFLVWLKRALPDDQQLSDPFDATNKLSPKQREAVWNRGHFVDGQAKNSAFYERAMEKAFAEGRRVLAEDGIGCVVFAHKTTEGWEALLSAMIRSGFTITGSWPVATEMGSRLNARDAASLATSVHLVCRPRSNEAGIGDWANILRELPRRVSDWMLRLESEGVHGADLVFACIGPALEIFSRYSSVETADGREVPLADYLAKVWEVVGRAALEQVLGTAEAKARNGGLGALEEDSRLTALFLWTLNSGRTELGEAAADDDSEGDEDEDDDEEETSSSKKKGLTLIYDIVRRFAQPLGIHLDVWEGRIIKTKKGVVRLLPVVERAHQLFGEAGAETLASSIEKSPAKAAQLELFPDSETKVAKIKPKGRKKAAGAGSSTVYAGQVTTLDRVHAAMLFQRQGQTNALRSLLAAEIERGPDFVRLANALSALYPRDSDEKRLLDAMLLALPRR